MLLVITKHTKRLRGLTGAAGRALGTSRKPRGLGSPPSLAGATNALFRVKAPNPGPKGNAAMGSTLRGQLLNISSSLSLFWKAKYRLATKLATFCPLLFLLPS